MMDLYAPVPIIDDYLRKYLQETEMPPNLRDALLYSVMGGGKRLRPILCWYCCTACGAAGENSLPAGAAIELIHAFSLVHDDLPALDNDDMRRGKPTLHRHAGEAMALLAGDMALTLAFRLVAEKAQASHMPFFHTSLSIATSHMINGQILDTLGGFDTATTDSQRVETVHRNKTAALIRAACLMGVRASIHMLPSDRNMIAIATYADRIGLMFQIVDDLIDIEQSTEHTGKRTGKDKDAGKLTYPSVHGIAGSRETVSRLLAESMQALEPLGTDAEPLRILTQTMASRTK